LNGVGGDVARVDHDVELDVSGIDDLASTTS
jgi:hypothetical protein